MILREFKFKDIKVYRIKEMRLVYDTSCFLTVRTHDFQCMWMQSRYIDFYSI